MLNVWLVMLLLAPLVVWAETPGSRALERVSSEAVAQFGHEDKVAVLVGVGAYPWVSGFRQLNYAAADAQALAGALASAGLSGQTAD